MTQTHLPEETAVSVLAGAGAGVLSCTGQGALVAVSSSAAGLLGYESADECVAAGSDAERVWEEPAVIANWLGNASAPLTLVVHAILPGGGLRALRLFRSPEPGETCTVIVMDAEAEASKGERKALVGRCEAMASTSGAIGHKLNNLLAGLVGYLSLLMQVIPDQSTQVSTYLKALETTSKRIQDLTSQLMIIDRKMSTASARQMDVSELIDETLAKSAEKLPSAEVTYTPAGEIIPMLGERQILGEALEEVLIEIAQMLTATRVAVTAGTEEIPQERAEALSVRAGTALVIRSEVTHPPFGRVARERIFEPYYTPTGKGKGAELRLAKAWGSIGLHRGTITVSAKGATETAIEVILPAHLS